METQTIPPPEKFTAKDLMTDQDVRWCPGCVDYSILAQVQRTMPDLKVSRHQTVFVAGIKQFSDAFNF